MSDKYLYEKEENQETAVPHFIPDLLPGLNVKEGIKRLGGTFYMYADLIKFFCNDKKDFPDNFRNLVKQKDFKNASILAHSLKGSAATISAADLSEAAKLLEKICSEADERRIVEALQRVEDKLTQVITSSEKILALSEADKPVEDSAQTDCDPSDIPELLKELEQSLQEFDPLESERYAKKIKGCIAVGNFNSVALDLAKNVEKQIRNYEFEAARKILQRLFSFIND